MNFGIVAAAGVAGMLVSCVVYGWYMFKVVLVRHPSRRALGP